MLFRIVILCSSYIVSVYSKNFDITKKDYISLESGEHSELNDIEDSESTEYVEKNNYNKQNFSGNEMNNDTLRNNPVTLTENVEKHDIGSVIKINKCPFLVNGFDSSSEERFENNIIADNTYTVAIQKRGSFYASGALIGKQAVLSTARDFFSVRESIKLYKVRLGSVNCKHGGVLLPIRSVEIHPMYVSGQPAYDVAVLMLGAPVDFTDNIKPIALSNAMQKVISAKFKTTYWPRLLNNTSILPMTAKERLSQRIMRVSMQRLIPWKTCYKLMKSRGALDETSQCLIPISVHHSDCMPDVGAPVVADDGLWGITSGWTSNDCVNNPSPTIFTRVNLQTIRIWIESMLQPSL